jgi:hypothetical protein
MSTSAIWFLVWAAGFLANIMNAIITGFPYESKNINFNQFCAVVLISCFSWGIVIIWLFSKITGKPDDKETY